MSAYETLLFSAVSRHPMRELREILGIECVKGWQGRCLAALADMLKKEMDMEHEPTRTELEPDTREKLEADAHGLLLLFADDLIKAASVNERTDKHLKADAWWNAFARLLDRQAAVTERECIANLNRANADFERAREELQAKVDELTGQLARAEAEANTQRNNFETVRKANDEKRDRMEALVRCLRADHGMNASWDGLRGFWSIEVTDEHVSARDALSDALDRACAYIADMCGTCPGDAKDYDRDCENTCDSGLMGAECWRHYFEHVKPDTVESILIEFAAIASSWEGVDELASEAIGEYTERIRKAVCNG